MTDLRKAAEKMLHILDNEPNSFTAWVDDMKIAREELRYALAQPVEAHYKPRYNPTINAFDTAPPKREWVGMTDEELKVLCDEWQIIYGGYVRPFAETIEAKLKEKNSG